MDFGMAEERQPYAKTKTSICMERRFQRRDKLLTIMNHPTYVGLVLKSAGRSRILTEMVII